MFVDFTAPSVPTLWVLATALGVLALIVFASMHPELAEVYVGDVHILLGTVALAALALMILSAHPTAATALGQLFPLR